MTHDGIIKIADFGTAIISCYQTRLTPGCGTKMYQAPEQKEAYYDSAVDIYPLGKLFITLLLAILKRLGSEIDCI